MLETGDRTAGGTRGLGVCVFAGKFRCLWHVGVCAWGRMGACGSLWARVGLSGCVWGHMNMLGRVVAKNVVESINILK